VLPFRRPTPTETEPTTSELLYLMADSHRALEDERKVADQLEASGDHKSAKAAKAVRSSLADNERQLAELTIWALSDKLGESRARRVQRVITGPRCAVPQVLS
jgi:hypothetical protein